MPCGVSRKKCMNNQKTLKLFSKYSIWPKDSSSVPPSLLLLINSSAAPTDRCFSPIYSNHKICAHVCVCVLGKAIATHICIFLSPHVVGHFWPVPNASMCVYCVCNWERAHNLQNGPKNVLGNTSTRPIFGQVVCASVRVFVNGGSSISSSTRDYSGHLAKTECGSPPSCMVLVFLAKNCVYFCIICEKYNIYSHTSILHSCTLVLSWVFSTDIMFLLSICHSKVMAFGHKDP